MAATIVRPVASNIATKPRADALRKALESVLLVISETIICRALATCRKCAVTQQAEFERAIRVFNFRRLIRFDGVAYRDLPSYPVLGRGVGLKLKRYEHVSKDSYTLPLFPE